MLGVCRYSSVLLTAQNDNILLIGVRTRDFVTGALGRNRARIESRQLSHYLVKHMSMIRLPTSPRTNWWAPNGFGNTLMLGVEGLNKMLFRLRTYFPGIILQYI